MRNLAGAIGKWKLTRMQYLHFQY